jgi:anti-sigma factor ChrR (cupin superfamily)
MCRVRVRKANRCKEPAGTDHDAHLVERMARGDRSALAALYTLHGPRLLAAKDPRAWYNPGLWGLQLIDVQGGPRTAGADLHLVKFKAGMRFPHHRHPGPEALLVLEGNYTDSDGRFVGPGDIHEMAPGTDHAFQVGSAGPCIAASLQSGREFTGLFMRALAKILT